MLKGRGTLTPLQILLITDFGKLQDATYFYLTGGTALAEFYLGHRRSYDLDFFTSEKDLILPFSRVFEKEMGQKQYSFKMVRRFESFCEFEVSKESESMRLHFAYDSPFRFEEPQISEFGVKINDYKDLAVDKFLTFFGRWKHRDAVDLFFILKTEPVETLMEMAKKKDPGFDLYWFSIALKEVDEFPDEIDQWPVELLVEVKGRELKEKFRTLSREVTEKIKK